MTVSPESTSDEMTFVTLGTIDEGVVQNAQELASIVGDVRSDVEALGGDVRETYCLLGQYDYVLVYDAPSEGVAVQIAITLEEYGLDVETMQAVHVDRLGEIVTDA